MVDRYPLQPGSKGKGTTRDTSAASAAAIAPNASHLRNIALRTLARLGAASVLECCEAAGLPRETLQPRFSELRKLGLIEPTGQRITNPSGHSAAILRPTPAGWARASA